MNPFVVIGAALIVAALVWYTFYTQREGKKPS
jgi:hypothetical protein